MNHTGRTINLDALGRIIHPPADRKEEDITYSSFISKKPAEADLEIEIEPESDFPSFGTTTPPKVDISSCITKEALTHTAQIKLFHWQTKSYAEHKTLDKLFQKFVQLTDDLVETVSGKYGRGYLTGEAGTLCLKNYEETGEYSLHSYLEEIIYSYQVTCKKACNPETDSEILNIIDEILATLFQTKYLLTLK